MVETTQIVLEDDHQVPVTLADVTVPACCLGQSGDLVRTDLHLADGRLTDRPGTRIEMRGALVLPAFVDMHTHLDKGHIWTRAPNPDGTFMGALTTVGADRVAHWSAEDVRRRADFAYPQFIGRMSTKQFGSSIY